MENSNLIPLEGKEIRKEWHNEEWYFSVVDVISVLTESPNPSRYWADLKRRSEKESGAKVFAFCEPLKMQTAGVSKTLFAPILRGCCVLLCPCHHLRQSR